MLTLMKHADNFLKCKNNIESINANVLKTIEQTYHKYKLYAAVKSSDL